MDEPPKILSQTWGVIDIAQVGRFRDAKLSPGTAREWDWRETGTRHVPGIQIADCEDLRSRKLTIEGRRYLEVERTLTLSYGGHAVEERFLGRMVLRGQRLWRVECGAPTALWPESQARCTRVVESFRVR